MNQDNFPIFRSSGDMLADRRYAYAKAAIEDEAYGEAVEILGQVLELAPYWPPALFMLGIAEDKLSHREAAIQALELAAALDAKDELGAGLHLARLGARPAPAAAAEAYVQRLFDQYAKHFDEHLVGMLAYRAPALLLETVSGIRPGVFSSVLDLGCGTGLCGIAFRAKAKTLCGVDLSPRMIEEAGAKVVYDRLAVASIEAFLAAEPAASADLLLAADVLVYIGDLAPVAAAAAHVLCQGGLFAFTVQRGDDGFQLGADLRFAHAPSYIEGAMTESGLKIVKMSEAVTRQDAGHDVPGLVVVAKRS